MLISIAGAQTTTHQNHGFAAPPPRHETEYQQSFLQPFCILNFILSLFMLLVFVSNRYFLVHDSKQKRLRGRDKRHRRFFSLKTLKTSNQHTTPLVNISKASQNSFGEVPYIMFAFVSIFILIQARDVPEGITKEVAHATEEPFVSELDYTNEKALLLFSHDKKRSLSSLQHAIEIEDTDNTITDTNEKMYNRMNRDKNNDIVLRGS